MLVEIDGKKPKISEGSFVAETANIIGEVFIGEECSIWFGAVIRGDLAKISIGNRTNIQDICMLHVENGYDLKIGNDVTVGHRAILHGCHIGNNVLIGMGSTVMDGAVIGNNCIVGAGALVTSGTMIPDNSLVIGFPAKVKRELEEKELSLIKRATDHYVDYAKKYMSKSTVHK